MSPAFHGRAFSDKSAAPGRCTGLPGGKCGARGRWWPIVGGGAHPRDDPGVQADITAQMAAAGQGDLLPLLVRQPPPRHQNLPATRENHLPSGCCNRFWTISRGGRSPCAFRPAIAGPTAHGERASRHGRASRRTRDTRVPPPPGTSRYPGQRLGATDELTTGIPGDHTPGHILLLSARSPTPRACSRQDTGHTPEACRAARLLLLSQLPARFGKIADRNARRSVAAAGTAIRCLRLNLPRFAPLAVIRLGSRGGAVLESGHARCCVPGLVASRIGAAAALSAR